jgi:putative membrane protein
MDSRLIGSFIAAAIAVFVASKLFSSVRVKSTGTLVLVSIVFGLLNVFVGWLVKVVLAIVLFPVALLSLGLPYLFLGFLANCVLLWVTDKLFEDFEVKTTRGLLATSGLISLAAWLLHLRH